MAKADPPEALSSEQIQATVLNSILHELSKVANTKQSAAGSKTKQPKQPPSRRHTSGTSHDSHDLTLKEAIERKTLEKAVHRAVEKAVGDKGYFLLLRTPRHHKTVFWSVVKELPELVERRQSEMLQSQMDALVDNYLPADPLAPALPEFIRDNAQARAEFMKEIPLLTAQQVADLAGHEAKNRSVTASRWRKAGSIFSVRHKGADLYPAFQFRDEEPHPTISKTLACLPTAMSGWQTAFWFAGANGWIGGARPMDVLDDEDSVLNAATHEGDVWMG